MSSLHFEVSADNSQLKKALSESEQAVKKTARAIEQSGTSVDEFFQKAQGYLSVVGGLFAVRGVSDFVQQVANVRGEFQQLEIAFNTMLGNRAKAEQLMAEIADTAAKTPFDLQGVAQGAKQLLAYGTAAEDVTSTLKRLGDIASGVSAPLNDIVYLYGTTMTQGRMFTQDLRQFQGRGIPLAEELAKQFGVAKSEVADLVTAGKVGAEEFKRAIESMAQSRFNNLMEEQSKSITGQISNLEDQLSQMFNEIGKQSEGAISTALSGASFLIEHYQAVGETLAVLTLSYGGYRAALMAQVAVNKALALSRLASIKGTTLLAMVTDRATAAQNRHNASILRNPYVLAAMALVGLAYAVYKVATASSVAEQAQESFNESLRKQAQASEEAENKAKSLLNTIRDSNETNYARNKAYDELLKLYPSLIGQIDIEILKTMKLTEAIKFLNDARDAKSLQDKQDYQDSLGVALSAFEINPHRPSVMRVKKHLTQAQKDALERHDSFGFWDKLSKTDNDLYKKLLEEQKLARKDSDKTKKEQAYARLSNEGKAKLHKSQGNAYAQEIKLLEQEQERAMAQGNRQRAEHLQKDIEKKRKLQEDHRAKEESFLKADSEARKRTYKSVSAEIKEVQEAWDNLSLDEQKGEEGKRLKAQIQALKKEQSELSLKDDANGKTKGGNKDKQAKEAQRQAEERIRQKKELNHQIIELEFAEEEAFIEATAQGTDKKRQLLDLEHRRTLAQLERQRAELLANSATDPAQAELIYQKGIAQADKKREQGEAEILREDAEAMRAYLLEYGTLEEKKRAIRERAEADLAKATTEGERLAITARMQQELSDLEQAYGQLRTTMSQIFGDLTDKTKQGLDELAERAEELRSYLTAGQWQEVGNTGRDQHGLTLKAFNELKDNPEKLQAIAKQTEEIKHKAQEAGGAFTILAGGVRDLFKAGDSPERLQKALGSIQKGLGEVSQGLGFVRDAFQTLADATGSDALRGLADGISLAEEAISKAQQGMQAGATIGGLFGPAGSAIGSAIGGAVGGVTSLIGSFAKMRDAKHERTIQALQRRVEALDKSYKNLGKEIDKAYSSDASKLISQQETLLRQKQSLLRQQMVEEEAKKKTDPEKLRRYREEIESIDDTIADNRQRAKDAIFGQDIKSAINDFATAYANAWAEGNDRAEASKNFVKKQIRSMVQELIKQKATPAIKALHDKLIEAWNDNIISDSEAKIVEGMGERLRQQLDTMLRDNKRWLEDDTTGSISGTKRGFEAMSQDTASELNGRFTAIQQDVRSLVFGLGEVRNLHLQSISHLEGIARNTHKLHEMSERLQAIERNTRALR